MNVYNIDNCTGSVLCEDEARCIKLHLPEHIAAYIERRDSSGELAPSICDSSSFEKIVNIQELVQTILSNLTWQDKSLCKHVCSMWRSAVDRLKREQLWPTDFSISMRKNSIAQGIQLLKSSNFYTEPLAVFLFTNRQGFISTARCKRLLVSPCEPPCENEHYLIDIIEREVAAPKNCMMTVKGGFVLYLPLPQAVTHENAVGLKTLLDPSPFLGGISIPAIPNVQFNIINIQAISLIKEEFFDVVDKLSETHYIKGALVFANKNFLLHPLEEIRFLNHFKTIQPDVPYALGGSIVDDTITDQVDVKDVIDGLNEGKDFNSENLICIGIFSVPRNVERDKTCNFEMYSLILESSVWCKDKIQSSINEFSKRVPRFEHSLAIKITCVDRDQFHEVEQEYFRLVFPTTRLVGCYGYGELGLNHPARVCTTDLEKSSKALKNGIQCYPRESGPQFGLMYSYSTSFVYFGWGKILSQPECF